MPTTDAALEKKREEVQELQRTLAAAEAESGKLLRERDNDSTADQLDAEIAALQQKIAEEHQVVTSLGGDPSAIKVPKAPVKRETSVATKATDKSDGEG